MKGTLKLTEKGFLRRLPFNTKDGAKVTKQQIKVLFLIKLYRNFLQLYFYKLPSVTRRYNHQKTRTVTEG